MGWRNLYGSGDVTHLGVSNSRIESGNAFALLTKKTEQGSIKSTIQAGFDTAGVGGPK